MRPSSNRSVLLAHASVLGSVQAMAAGFVRPSHGGTVPSPNRVAAFARFSCNCWSKEITAVQNAMTSATNQASVARKMTVRSDYQHTSAFTTVSCRCAERVSSGQFGHPPGPLQPPKTTLRFSGAIDRMLTPPAAVQLSSRAKIIPLRLFDD